MPDGDQDAFAASASVGSTGCGADGGFAVAALTAAGLVVAVRMYETLPRS